MIAVARREVDVAEAEEQLAVARDAMCDAGVAVDLRRRFRIAEPNGPVPEVRIRNRENVAPVHRWVHRCAELEAVTAQRDGASRFDPQPRDARSLRLGAVDEIVVPVAEVVVVRRDVVVVGALGVDRLADAGKPAAGERMPQRAVENRKPRRTPREIGVRPRSRS